MSVKSLKLLFFIPGDNNYFKIELRKEETIYDLKCRIKEEKDERFAYDINIFKSDSIQPAKEIIEICKVRRDDVYGSKISKDKELISEHLPNIIIRHKTEIRINVFVECPKK
ncbi:hypothetical protein Glove_470g15 [Diversispora epigaea]|uniref:Crinkler effector protein N-terminal domain-containing protein n=1 Tax=Diversispora epigaea TaxID=1348612 RepID=A0A397GQG0_9GLOM|nr:hypothetical protein Glove_470g15 [Diversispora epigaea]